jgi:hypothetical protein
VPEPSHSDSKLGARTGSFQEFHLKSHVQRQQMAHLEGKIDYPGSKGEQFVYIPSGIQLWLFHVIELCA